MIRGVVSRGIFESSTSSLKFAVTVRDGGIRGDRFVVLYKLLRSLVVNALVARIYKVTSRIKAL